jgi:hypothetical protein
VSERGDVADWLGTGLQSPLIGFDSRRRLKLLMVATASCATMLGCDGAPYDSAQLRTR